MWFSRSWYGASNSQFYGVTSISVTNVGDQICWWQVTLPEKMRFFWTQVRLKHLMWTWSIYLTFFMYDLFHCNWVVAEKHDRTWMGVNRYFDLKWVKRSVRYLFGSTWSSLVENNANFIKFHHVFIKLARFLSENEGNYVGVSKN